MEEIVKICKAHGELKREDIGTQNKCKYCIREWSAKWKAANREKHRASANRKRNTDPIAKDKRNQKEVANRLVDNSSYVAREKRRREKYGSKRTDYEIARRRGIGVEEYLAIFKKQDYKCIICNLPERKKNRKGEIARLTLDHDHITGKNRELLCHTCNLSIGLFKENISIIQSAIAYLKKGGK